MLAIRARAPGLSRLALFVYVCLLAVTALGHRCEAVSGDPSEAVGIHNHANSRLAADRPHAPAPDERQCLACSLQRQTVSTPAARVSFTVVAPLPTSPFTPLAPGLLTGAPFSHPTRGPPAS